MSNDRPDPRASRFLVQPGEFKLSAPPREALERIRRYPNGDLLLSGKGGRVVLGAGSATWQTFAEFLDAEGIEPGPAD